MNKQEILDFISRKIHRKPQSPEFSGDLVDYFEQFWIDMRDLCNSEEENEEEEEIEPDYDQFDDRDSDNDSGMSHSQQSACDRSDYANEMVESGNWSEEQASEFKMGA